MPAGPIVRTGPAAGVTAIPTELGPAGTTAARIRLPALPASRARTSMLGASAAPANGFAACPSVTWTAIWLPERPERFASTRITSVAPAFSVANALRASLSASAVWPIVLGSAFSNSGSYATTRRECSLITSKK